MPRQRREMIEGALYHVGKAIRRTNCGGASCGIERWDQRAGELAAVLREHPVVVSRWVAEAIRIRSENHSFADELDALDRTMAKKAIERLEDLRASEEES